MSAVRIVLSGIPPSLNKFAGRKNVNDYRRAKDYWTQAVGWAVKAIKDRPATFQRARVEILYYFPDKRRHDPDNYCGKLLLDGLTMAGVIADDDFAHITLAVAGVVDRSHPRTVITVTEVTE